MKPIAIRSKKREEIIDIAGEDEIVLAAVERRAKLGRPLVVALDGGSGAGKSTIAARLATRAEVAIIPLDDFYQTTVPEVKLNNLTAAQKHEIVFDWPRVREDVLLPLRESREARWNEFDFPSGLTEAGTYGLSSAVKTANPAPIIVLEGAYSASPQLRASVDIAVLIDVPTKERHARLKIRDNNSRFLSRWHSIWDEVEEYYFEHVCPPSSYDMIISN